LDDLSAYGAGLEFGYGDLTLGGSWLQSNNALIDGDYTAYDVGITWKPSALGFSLAYGHAEDDNVGLTSDQGTFGVTYEFDKFTLGTGIQYVDRTTNAALEGLLFAPIEETGTSVFVEGGFKF
jgi:predicted porin